MILKKFFHNNKKFKTVLTLIVLYLIYFIMMFWIASTLHIENVQTLGG